MFPLVKDMNAPMLAVEPVPLFQYTAVLPMNLLAPTGSYAEKRTPVAGSHAVVPLKVKLRPLVPDDLPAEVKYLLPIKSSFICAAVGTMYPAGHGSQSVFPLAVTLLLYQRSVGAPTHQSAIVGFEVP